jgi:hypothetical protein
MTMEQFEEACESFNHIKIAIRHSLTEWEKATAELNEDWKFFLCVCGLISQAME